MTTVQEAPPATAAPAKRKAPARVPKTTTVAVTEEAAPAEAVPEITPPVVLSKRGHNIASIEGFLKEYDYWAAVFNRNHGWCYLEYAYENTTHAYGNKIPFPQQRENNFGLSSTPWEHLNDAGRQAKIEAEQQVLTNLYASLIKAIEYGCSASKRYLTVDEANQALDSFGLPHVMSEQSYDATCSVSIYFSTQVRMNDLGIRNEDVQRKLTEALITALDELAGTPVGTRIKGAGFGTNIHLGWERRPVERIVKTNGGQLETAIAELLGKPAEPVQEKLPA